MSNIACANVEISQSPTRDYFKVSYPFFLPLFALALVSIIIGAIYGGSTCDDRSFISLSTWLIVYGSVSLAFLPILFLVIFIFAASGSFSSTFLIILFLVFALFDVAWNIVGAVSLFGDNMQCQEEDPALWIMTLIVLILQWLSLILALIPRRMLPSSRTNNT